MTDFSFRLIATDGAARTGEIATAHGSCARQPSCRSAHKPRSRACIPTTCAASGADIMLGNTYHLMLRPGAERVAALGGLHAFMRWPYPILTDSGGYQVMSLSALRKVAEAGVTFRSHIDGAMVELSPERAVEVQILLGSDIAMQLDECVSLPADRHEIERAMRLSLRWAERCKRAFENAPADRALFGIVQGGDDQNCARRARERSSKSALTATPSAALPSAKRRTVMLQRRRRDRACAARGSAALSHGRRHAGGPPRSGRARHRHVRLRLADAQRPSRACFHALRPDQHQECASCRRCPAARRDQPLSGRARDFSRAYLHHLFKAGEALGGTLLSIVNLFYYQDLMAGARAAIAAGQYADYVARTTEQWSAKRDVTTP